MFQPTYIINTICLDWILQQLEVQKARTSWSHHITLESLIPDWSILSFQLILLFLANRVKWRRKVFDGEKLGRDLVSWIFNLGWKLGGRMHFFPVLLPNRRGFVKKSLLPCLINGKNPCCDLVSLILNLGWEPGGRMLLFSLLFPNRSGFVTEPRFLSLTKIFFNVELWFCSLFRTFSNHPWCKPWSRCSSPALRTLL